MEVLWESFKIRPRRRRANISNSAISDHAEVCPSYGHMSREHYKRPKGVALIWYRPSDVTKSQAIDGHQDERIFASTWSFVEGYEEPCKQSSILSMRCSANTI